jgi:hypothetical protein
MRFFRSAAIWWQSIGPDGQVLVLSVVFAMACLSVTAITLHVLWLNEWLDAVDKFFQ